MKTIEELKKLYSFETDINFSFDRGWYGFRGIYKTSLIFMTDTKFIYNIKIPNSTNWVGHGRKINSNTMKSEFIWKGHELC